MSNTKEIQDRSRLQQIARKAMIDRGLLPDFSVQAIDQLNGMEEEMKCNGYCDHCCNVILKYAANNLWKD